MRRRLPFILAFLVLSAAVVLLYTGVFHPAGGPTRPEKTFPSRIGGFVAEEVRYDPEVIGVLSPDEVVYKRFQRKDTPPITLFLALYEGLEKTDFSHSPIVCFTGQGWEIEKQGKKELPLRGENRNGIRVNQLIQNKMGTRMITFFWYESRRGALHNRGFMKLTLFYDALLGRSARNAFVRVTAVVPETESAEWTADLLADFVREMYPALRRFILD